MVLFEYTQHSIWLRNKENTPTLILFVKNTIELIDIEGDDVKYGRLSSGMHQMQST